MKFFSQLHFRIQIPLICSAVSLLYSCSPLTRPTSYFRKVSVDSFALDMPKMDKPVLISSGDQLTVSISSFSREEDEFFNKAAAPVSKFGEPGSMPAYTVDDEGYILIHKIGRVRAAGLSRIQLKEVLQSELKPYLKDPIVTVTFSNHKVTLMGEVNAPRVVVLPEDRVSLLDVLALGGDLTINGRRDHVMVIRQSGDKKILHRVTLEDGSVFSSPWYWLQHNDIVYVSADDDRRYREERRNRFSMYFSMTLSTLSLLIIILDRLL